MATQKSGSSKLCLAIGSLVAVALIFGVLHKTGNLSTQDDYELMGVIPEQIIIENAVASPETPRLKYQKMPIHRPLPLILIIQIKLNQRLLKKHQ